MGKRSREESLVLLNPKSTSGEPMPPGTNRQLTGEDVMGALAICRDRVGAMLLMLRVADHWGVYRRLYAAVREIVRDRAAKDRWQCRSPYRLDEMIDGIAQHAVLEHCFPARCPECKGRGHKYPVINGQEVTRECRRCLGTGGIRPTASSRAAGIGVTADAWRKYWETRYRAVQQELLQRDSEACRQLAEALR